MRRNLIERYETIKKVINKYYQHVDSFYSFKHFKKAQPNTRDTSPKTIYLSYRLYVDEAETKEIIDYWKFRDEYLNGEVKNTMMESSKHAIDEQISNHQDIVPKYWEDLFNILSCSGAYETITEKPIWALVMHTPNRNINNYGVSCIYKSGAIMFSDWMLIERFVYDTYDDFINLVKFWLIHKTFQAWENLKNTFVIRREDFREDLKKFLGPNYNIKIEFKPKPEYLNNMLNSIIEEKETTIRNLKSLIKQKEIEFEQELEFKLKEKSNLDTLSFIKLLTIVDQIKYLENERELAFLFDLNSMFIKELLTPRYMIVSPQYFYEKIFLKYEPIKDKYLEREIEVLKTLDRIFDGNFYNIPLDIVEDEPKFKTCEGIIFDIKSPRSPHHLKFINPFHPNVNDKDQSDFTENETELGIIGDPCYGEFSTSTKSLNWGNFMEFLEMFKTINLSSCFWNEATQYGFDLIKKYLDENIDKVEENEDTNIQKRKIWSIENS